MVTAPEDEDVVVHVGWEGRKERFAVGAKSLSAARLAGTVVETMASRPLFCEPRSCSLLFAYASRLRTSYARAVASPWERAKALHI